MKNKIKTFSLFVRPDEKSRQIANKIRELNSKLENPMTETEENSADLVIAIGGDGCFIRAVTSTHFSKKAVYTGIHTGTLGFMQELSEEDISELLQHVTTEENLKTRKVFIAIVNVFLKDGSFRQFFALNDVIVAGNNYSKIAFAEYIHDELLQNISGCGINIATSTGDTALSKSLGSAIDFSNNFQLVCELIAPIQNDATENFLANSIICSKIKLVLKPSDDIIIKIDALEQDIDSRLIESVEVSMTDDTYCIHKLDLKNYSKVKVCRDKLLGYKD